MSSAVLGDITGDGIAEVLVGSPYAYYFANYNPDDGTTTQQDWDGAVFVLDVTNDGSPGDVKVAHIQGPVDSYSIWGGIWRLSVTSTEMV